ncbi:MAG: HD domain-containing protein [Candidatus Omnitrophica bacterium]|nr:HD domain-containing protein [Candidatus Omnitrophota bacterium]
MGRVEKVEIIIRNIISSLQMAKLYSSAHPIFKNSLTKAYESLRSILEDMTELIIGIIGNELAFEKEIFFELSRMAEPMIAYLKERGIERIVFHSGLQEQELEKFIAFLSEYPQDTGKDPQEILTSLGIRNISAGKIKVGSSKAEAEALRGTAQIINYLDLYNNYQGNVSQSIENVLDNETVDYLALRLGVTSIMENLILRHQELLKLATIKRYDLNTFVHIVNVSILAMYFSSKLGFSRDNVLTIGIAGLFHDIGKLYISRKIIGKQDKLTGEEFEKIKNHALLGAEILLKYVNAMGILPAVVAFEHHLKYDLSGYPRLAFAQKPHIASLIISICDVYDALSQRRSYKSEYPPNRIYDFMIKEKGRYFDPVLLERFFKITGVWPIGTIVLLSDSRVAVVRQENEEEIFCPKVEVIHPADRQELIDLRQQKESLKIERALNPFTEAKPYLALI